MTAGRTSADGLRYLRRAILFLLLAQGAVSIGLMVVAVIIHGSDAELSATLLVGVLAFWLGNSNMAAQMSALAVLDRQDGNEG